MDTALAAPVQTGDVTILYKVRCTETQLKDHNVKQVHAHIAQMSNTQARPEVTHTNALFDGQSTSKQHSVSMLVTMPPMTLHIRFPCARNSRLSRSSVMTSASTGAHSTPSLLSPTPPSAEAQSGMLTGSTAKRRACVAATRQWIQSRRRSQRVVFTLYAKHKEGW